MKRILTAVQATLLAAVFTPGAESALLYAIEGGTVNKLTVVDSAWGAMRGSVPLGSSLKVAFGGLSFDDNRQLHYLGGDASRSEPGRLIIDDIKLWSIDRTSGEVTEVGTVFPTPPRTSADGFAIINNTGYTIHHENDNTLAQLYAVDLATATPTRIGTGYPITPAGASREKILGLTTDGTHLYGIQEGNSAADGRRLVRFDLATGLIDEVIGADFPELATANLAFTDDKFWFTNFTGVPDNTDIYSYDPDAASPLPTLVWPNRDFDLQFVDGLAAAPLDMAVDMDLSGMQLTGVGDINGVRAEVSITPTAGIPAPGALTGVITELSGGVPTTLFLEGNIELPFDLTLKDLDGQKPDLRLQGTTEALLRGEEYPLVPMGGSGNRFGFDLAGGLISIFDGFLFDTGGVGLPGDWGDSLLLESLLAEIVSGNALLDLSAQRGSMRLAELSGDLLGQVNPPFTIPLTGFVTARTAIAGMAPEPGTLALFAIALLAAGTGRCRLPRGRC